MSEFDLDDALSNMEISEGDSSAEGGDDIDLDAAFGEMDASEGDSGGGEGIELDDDLAAFAEDSGDDSGDAGGALDLEAELGALESQVSGGAPAKPSSSTGGFAEDSVNIDFLLDIKLHVTFEVGRSKMLVSDLLTLGQGSVIELHRLVGDELDLFVNGKLVARGEVVVVNEKFGCRITNIVPPEDRVKYLADY